MRIGRLILVAATLVTILVFPYLMKDAIQALRLPSAYAAPNVFDSGGRVYQNGNINDNDDINVGGNNDDDDNDNRNGNNDNDDESDNEGEDEDNDNVECFANLNSNEEVPCDFEDNDNGDAPPPAPAAAPAPSGGTGSSVDRCFSASETGGLFLDAPDYDVTITVVNPLGSGTRLSLRAVDPASVPAVPAGSTLLDSAVWHLDAQVGCDGGGVGMLPAAVNNGFAYSVSADKSKLQIVRLENGAWVEVTTVPDPSKPYISATIQNAGTYAVIQKP
jgi:hypothetical protein